MTGMFNISWSCLDLTAPEAPEAAQQLLPAQPDSFWEGLLSILREALPVIDPALAESLKICGIITAVCLLLALFEQLPARQLPVLELSAALVLGINMLGASRSLIALGTESVQQISEYGKLLLPVLTAALTAEGGVTASTAMYAGTAFFNALLSTAVSKLLVPLLYLYFSVSITCCIAHEQLMQKLKELIKWLMTWVLKLILYVFTGYIGITGVVSGSADAAALKATKLTISGAVPVVGSILSDASEAVLVGASVVKNAAGIYGMLVIAALFISPFLQIGVQYLLMKATSAVCEMFSPKKISVLIWDFSTVMGFLVAMIGAVCLMQMISIVCFMRGIG